MIEALLLLHLVYEELIKPSDTHLVRGMTMPNEASLHEEREPMSFDLEKAAEECWEKLIPFLSHQRERDVAKIAAFGRRCYEAGREACEENHVIKTVERSEFCHHDDPSWCTEKCKGRNR